MHVRLWRFAVPAETEERFLAAYRSDGDWAWLFATASGFVRTELWRRLEAGEDPQHARAAVPLGDAAA